MKNYLQTKVNFLYAGVCVYFLSLKVGMKNTTLFVYCVSPSFQSWSHSLKILLISLNIDKLIFKERMNNFESTTVKMKYAENVHHNMTEKESGHVSPSPSIFTGTD